MAGIEHVAAVFKTSVLGGRPENPIVYLIVKRVFLNIMARMTQPI